ncbi:MAG: putative DCC family thiol-disulfide oxidoreductase YuxK, partial [Planctomycetota bacterium]
MNSKPAHSEQQVQPAWSQWTGGQFSILRAFLGLYLVLHFAIWVPQRIAPASNASEVADQFEGPLFNWYPGIYHLSDSNVFFAITVGIGLILALALAVGWHVRTVAILLFIFIASELTRDPNISSPSLFYLGFLLIMCAVQAPAPFGSIAAKGRIDPAGDWKPNTKAWAALWITIAFFSGKFALSNLGEPTWQDGSATMGFLYHPNLRTGFVEEFLTTLPRAIWNIATWSYLGYALLVAPLALFRRLRILPWLGMLGCNLMLMLVIDSPSLTVTSLLISLAAFDPAWLAPKRGAKPAWVFYDGECGLCHRTVRMILAEDTNGDGFVFAPLGSPAFEAHVTPEQRASLPDSIALVTADGHLLTRTRAVIAILERLGGLWRALAFALRLLPRPIADAGYD